MNIISHVYEIQLHLLTSLKTTSSKETEHQIITRKYLNKSTHVNKLTSSLASPFHRPCLHKHQIIITKRAILKKKKKRPPLTAFTRYPSLLEPLQNSDDNHKASQSMVHNSALVEPGRMENSSRRKHQAKLAWWWQVNAWGQEDGREHRSLTHLVH